MDAKSNHPNSMKRNIFLACKKRLLILSSNKKIFNAAAAEYQAALEKVGYSHKLVYQRRTGARTSRKRIRSKPNTWFNPP